MPSLLSILLIALAIYFIFVKPTRRPHRQHSSTTRKSYTRWIAGGIGWAFGGPIGALLGYAIGSLADKQMPGDKQTITGPGDFKLSLTVLTAAVMKADGRVKKSELNFVKDFLVKQFGRDEAGEMLILLRDLLDKEIDLRAVGNQIGMMMDPSAKQQLLYYLFGISTADGELTQGEFAVIETLSRFMGISKGEFNAIHAMFNKKLYDPYKILEISREAKNEEIKKAYRQAAMKYHPDRVAHLGESVKKEAEEKFKKIVEAYDAIKKERNF